MYIHVRTYIRNIYVLQFNLGQIFPEEKGRVELHFPLSAGDDGDHHVEGGTVVLPPQLIEGLVSMEILTSSLVACPTSIESYTLYIHVHVHVCTWNP